MFKQTLEVLLTQIFSEIISSAAWEPIKSQNTSTLRPKQQMCILFLKQTKAILPQEDSWIITVGIIKLFHLPLSKININLQKVHQNHPVSDGFSSSEDKYEKMQMQPAEKLLSRLLQFCCNL